MENDRGGKELTRGAQPCPAPQETQVIIISVKVKPNARASALVPGENGVWLAQLKSPPVDGKANEELLRLVARHFGCPRSAVSLKSGASARTKLVRIEGAGPILQNGAPPPQSRHEP